jgi:hypothetical protein
VPLYAEANTYAHLLPEAVAGNPEVLSPEALHERAWEIVEPVFSHANEAAWTRYERLAGTGMTSTDIREVVPAALHGRVDVLFVGLGVQQWGRYTPQDDAVHLSTEPASGDEDLVDLAAMHSVLNGGTVYTEHAQQIPNGAPLAAIFRY